MVRTRDRRHAPIAARLTGWSLAAATGALIDREIVLDWPAAIERTRAGRALIETTASLVVRFCPQLRIRPTSTLASAVADHVVAIDSTAAPAGSTSRDPLAVHLGGGGRADVTGSAHGWVAFVSGIGEELPPIREDDQVLGAHAAAGFVASQVFVRALRLDTQIAGPTARTAYSTFEYGPPTGVPPAITRPVIDGVLLGGCGAVGQACVDVLVSADVRGLLPVVDAGLVDDPTNLNRSVLAVERDLHDVAPKAQLAARRAKDGPLAVEPVQRSIAEVVAAIEAGERPWPSVVLSAFDNRLARWALQACGPTSCSRGRRATRWRRSSGMHTARRRPACAVSILMTEEIGTTFGRWRRRRASTRRVSSALSRAPARPSRRTTPMPRTRRSERWSRLMLAVTCAACSATSSAFLEPNRHRPSSRWRSLRTSRGRSWRGS
jgi:ThiF family